jgi:hypothetical protein
MRLMPNSLLIFWEKVPFIECIRAHVSPPQLHPLQAFVDGHYTCLNVIRTHQYIPPCLCIFLRHRQHPWRWWFCCAWACDDRGIGIVHCWSSERPQTQWSPFWRESWHAVQVEQEDSPIDIGRISQRTGPGLWRRPCQIVVGRFLKVQNPVKSICPFWTTFGT